MSELRDFADFSHRHAGRGMLILLVAFAVAKPVGASSFVAFESGQVRPVALSPDGTRLFAVNTPDNRLEIFAVGESTLTWLDSVPVGLEPVAVAARTDDELWVVNHLSDSVSIVDSGSLPPRVTHTLLVGDEPRDIVFGGADRGRAFITTAHRGQNSPIDPQLTTPGVGRADVWVFDAQNLGASLGGNPLTVITLFGDTPRALAVSPDGQKVYAAVFHSGNQTTSIGEGLVCNGGATAGPCTIFGGSYPGGLPGPGDNVEGVARPETGLILKFDPDSQEWRDELGLNWNNAVRFNLPDKDVFVIDAAANPPVESGFFTSVGTVIYNMAVNPVTGTVYVSNTEARNEVRFEGPGDHAGSSVRGHLHESRITVLDRGVAVPRHLNPHIEYATVPSPPEVKEKSLAIPASMAVSGDGTTLYVAAFGSRKIAVFDTAELENGAFVPDPANHIVLSGGGPSGLVLDEQRGQLYVLTRFDNAISIVDVETATQVEHVSLHNPEPASVVAGRHLLYDASLTSSNGEAACASCHVFGDFDSLAWDLGNPDAAVRSNPNPIRFGDPDFHPMKGPTTTQTLRGLANHGPMQWRGDRSGAFDGFDPLDETQALKQFAEKFVSLLGRDAPMSDPEMQALADFVLQIKLPPNPIRALDNSLTPEQQAGRDFYFNVPSSPSPTPLLTCSACHRIDPANGLFGTEGFTSNVGEPQSFKEPHFRNMYQKIGMFGMPVSELYPLGPPAFHPTDNGHKGDQIRGFGYLHDGSVDTVFRIGGLFTILVYPGGDPQRREMEQFLLAFDSNLAPIVGQQVTLFGANGATAGPRIDLLLARAARGECEVIAKGTLRGESRGWRWTDTGVFQSDRVGEPPIGDDDLRAHAAVAGQEVTYTCTPPGSGTRAGIDRDEDGFLDRDELDAGSDPADPGSIPVCEGDFDGDFKVTVNELVQALGNALSGCFIAFCDGDFDGDGQVRIDELLRTVGHALCGCVGSC